MNDKLDEILESMGESYYPMHEYPPSYEPQNKEARADAHAAIIQLITDACVEEQRMMTSYLVSLTDVLNEKPLLNAILGYQERRLSELQETKGEQ
jgi:hypothetical protein